MYPIKSNFKMCSNVSNCIEFSNANREFSNANNQGKDHKNYKQEIKD